MQEILLNIKNSGKRIRDIKDHFSLTFEDLKGICGISITAIQAIMNGEYKGYDVSILLNLYKNYPTLNLHWVLTGEGEMIKALTEDANIDELKDMALALARAKIKIDKLEGQLKMYRDKEQSS